MKSKLFGEFDLSAESGEEFLRGLEASLAATNDQWVAILDSLIPILQSATVTEKRLIGDDLRSRTGLTNPDTDLVCYFAQFWLSQMLSYSEDLELWVEDLGSIDRFANIDHALLLARLKQLRDDYLPAYITHAAISKQRGGMLPMLTGVGSSVEIRGVFTDRYKIGEDSEAYEPSPIATLPVVSISLKVDAGMPQRFMFQVTLDKLDELIKSMQVAKKEAGALQEYLKAQAE